MMAQSVASLEKWCMVLRGLKPVLFSLHAKRGERGIPSLGVLPPSFLSCRASSNSARMDEREIGNKLNFFLSPEFFLP